jgi:signal transduction histidine kinase
MLLVGSASLALTMAAFVSAWVGFGDLPPRIARMVWAGYVLMLFSYWLAMLAVTAAVPDPVRIPGWRLAPVAIDIGTFIGVLGVIGLFMPWGTTELQHVSIFFASSYGAIISVNEQIMTRFKVVTVFAGLAAVCVIQQIPLWPFLTAYLGIMAVVLILFSDLLRSSMAELRAARTEAEAARDARTRFLASAAHDLGQPLQAARLFFEQAIRAPTADARSTAAAHARNAFFGMEELLHAMLDHLRLSAGTVAVTVEPLPVMPLIASCAARYGAVAASEGVRLVPLPTRAVVRGDRALIERALGNLIDNALRHADASRVLIGAWRRPDGVLRLFVADDGRGLEGRDAEPLFEDYVQADDSMVEARGGFGIGLGSARRAAQAMGGSAGHDPAWYAGALFYLDLPGDDPHTGTQWGRRSIAA